MSGAPDPLSLRLARFPGLALEVDSHDRVVNANDAARDCLGDERVFPRLLDAASRSQWELLTGGQRTWITAELHLENDSREGPRSFYVSPLTDERRTIIEIPRDPDTSRLHDELNALNSDLVNAHRELTKRREELRRQQEQSARLNRMLEKQADELRRVLRSRERFFSAMSHELRTPLTGILGYGHLLLDGIGGPLAPKPREFVERMLSAAQHLNSLLDDILDLAKLESGTLELTLEQTIIADVIAEVLATVRPAAAAAGSGLQTRLDEAPEFITADARALRQILLNLMSNAIKFGGGEPVTLTCTRNGARVHFEVADRGVGVAPGEEEQIFEEFGQAEAGRQQKGTGLGLSISRQLAERMGGRLMLKRGQEKGATFVLDLPVTGPAEA